MTSAQDPVYVKLLDQCNLLDTNTSTISAGYNLNQGRQTATGQQSMKRTKTCTERMNEANSKKYNAVKQKFGGIDASVARAAFMKNDIWPPGTEITIGFLDQEPPPDDWTKINALHFRTPTPEIEQQSRMEHKPIDPLQLEVKQNTPVIEFTKRIVKERFEGYLNLKFVFVDEYPEDAMIRIKFNPHDGAYSYLGKSNLDVPGGDVTMNLGWFDVSTTMHEFCHMLGMVHEHQNPKGGVNWNPCKVFQWARDNQGWDAMTTYENILRKYDTSEINASEFDPLSVMLYFFDGELTKDGKGTKQNLRLSPLDVEFLNNMYALTGGYKVNSKAVGDFYKKAYGQSLEKAFTEDYIDNPNVKTRALSSMNTQSRLMMSAGVAFLLIALIVVVMMRKS